jgi:hypothetical protein
LSGRSASRQGPAHSRAILARRHRVQRWRFDKAIKNPARMAGVFYSTRRNRIAEIAATTRDYSAELASACCAASPPACC